MNLWLAVTAGGLMPLASVVSLPIACFDRGPSRRATMGVAIIDVVLLLGSGLMMLLGREPGTAGLVEEGGPASSWSSEFHNALATGVHGLVLLALLAISAAGVFRGRPRWPALLLAPLAGVLLVLERWPLEDALFIPLTLGLGALIIAGTIAFVWLGRNDAVGIRPLTLPSVGLRFGLLGVMGWALRGTLALTVLAALLNVTPGPPAEGVSEVLGKVESAGGSYLIFVLLVLWAPVAEELVFRGALLPWMCSWMKPWHALAVSSVLFGLIHIDSHGLAVLITIGHGAVLGWVRLRTGRIYPSILLHAAINLVAGAAFLLR